jgi:hypothetical protein
MDFTKRDARAAAETAQFCHLRWPETGESIMDGDKPVGAMVLGSSARSVQAALKADNRAKLQSAKNKEDEIRALEDIQSDMVKSAARLTVGFQGVQRGDADATAEDAAWFYDLNMFSAPSLLSPDPKRWQNLSFAQQVLAFSNDAGNFLGNA